jgi:hypothetical protein
MGSIGDTGSFNSTQGYRIGSFIDRDRIPVVLSIWRATLDVIEVAGPFIAW